MTTIASATKYRASLDAAFDARVAYEQSKCDDATASIFKAIADLRKDYAHDAIIDVMRKASVNAEFINRQERRNARYNVKSATKVFQIARCVAKVASLDSYTRNVLRTAFNLHNAELTMTHADAQASLDNAARVADAKKAHVVRYAKAIAASTADTQSSSSINALQMFDVLKETRDDSNAVAYALNAQSDVTHALLASLNLKLPEASASA